MDIDVTESPTRVTQPFAQCVGPGPEALGTSDLVLHSKQYRVLGVLGQGGMGTVYRAYDSGLERDVAIKVMKPGLPGYARQRFRQEALHGARLCHPNIARVYDLGVLPKHGLDWFAMEFLAGQDLEVLLRRARQRNRRLPLRLVARIFDRILDALSTAHEAGVVHRDIKPGNIFIVRPPGSRHLGIKLLDFGVALDLRRAATPTEICGDARYIAPEQSQPGCALDGRVDVYAAGISLFEALTGRHPFADLLTAEPEALIFAHRSREVPPPSRFLPPDVPAPLRYAMDVVVKKACAKHPDVRFGSAVAMREALWGATGRAGFG
jgi:serine/threonine-protein kinase